MKLSKNDFCQELKNDPLSLGGAPNFCLHENAISFRLLEAHGACGDNAGRASGWLTVDKPYTEVSCAQECKDYNYFTLMTGGDMNCRCNDECADGGYGGSAYEFFDVCSQCFDVDTPYTGVSCAEHNASTGTEFENFGVTVQENASTGTEFENCPRTTSLEFIHFDISVPCLKFVRKQGGT